MTYAFGEEVKRVDKAIPEEELREGLDRIIREVTDASAGILLTRGEAEPSDHICTVHIGFRRGGQSSLSLRADTSMFVRLARGMMQTEDLTPEDVEEVAKEYFNVLCGHVLSRLFQVTRLPARFSVPSFCRGRHVMEDNEDYIILNYIGDQNEWVQLIHHTPCGTGCC